MGVLAQVPAHHVDAKGQRQPRLLLPLLPQVEHLVQAHALVGDLAFVDEQAQVGLALQHHSRDLVEGHLDGGRVPDVEAQQERGGGVAARDGDDLLLELRALDRPLGHQDGTVALSHGRSRIHHPVAVVHQGVGGGGDRGHLEFAGSRAPIQRFDVLQHVLDGDPGDLHLAGIERVEHEGVVGVGTVTDANEHATSLGASRE